MSTDIYSGERRSGLTGIAVRCLDRLDENALTRWVLWVLMFGCLFVLGMELRDIVDAARQPPVVVTTVIAEPTVTRRDQPVPSVARPVPRTWGTGLDQPITFTMEADGVLAATGRIDKGAAGRLETELELHGGDVRAVSLNSPGGSLDDAILMARVIRRHGLATEVEDGALCASSCPLIFAGGIERIAGAKAAIGVHQFYASTDLSEDPAAVMADAQLTTVRIVRHLEGMGVDPALWFNALATPPQSLYYLSRGEMADYRLVTVPSPTAGSRDAPS